MSTPFPTLRGTYFSRFWGAQICSQVGQRFGLLALPVVAIQTLSADSAEVGYLTASLTLCYLIVGLPAGAWVDRWPKRSTMFWSALLRAAMLGTVPVLFLAGGLSIGWLLAVGLVVGTASVFFDVAYQSYVPLIVSDAALESANSRLESSAQVAAAGGPAVAGLLLRGLAAPFVLAVDAASYVLCACLLSSIRDDEKERISTREEPARRLRTEISEGLSFVVRSPVLRRLLVAVGVSNFFATIVMTLLPLLILRDLALGTTVMGVALGVGALGGVAGALSIPAVRRRFSVGTVMAGGLLTAATSTAAFPLAGAVPGPVSSTALLVAGQFGMTFGAVMFNVTQVSVRQRFSPKALLARMTASVRFVVWGSMPLAAVTAGWIGAGLGVEACMWIGVVGTCVTVLPILGMDRLIRTTEQTSEVSSA